MVVRIYGRLKCYKEQRVLQGGAIIVPEEGEKQMLFHTLRIASEWLYLTGRALNMRQTKEMDQAQDAIDLARRGRVDPSSAQRADPYSEAQDALADYFEKEEKESLPKQEIINCLSAKMQKSKANEFFDRFINEGILMETEAGCYKMN